MPTTGQSGLDDMPSSPQRGAQYHSGTLMTNPELAVALAILATWFAAVGHMAGAF